MSSRATHQEEQRSAERQSAHLRVHYQSLGRATADELTHTDNLTTDGMFIATRRPLPRRTRLYVEAFLDASSEAVVGFEAVVRWRRRFREPRGMGVEIVAAAAADRERLAVWLAEVGEADGSAAARRAS